eukprot:scaffold250981_cov63-Attheya_sp.AAC.1
MTLQNLPTHCDGCNVKCNIDHALNCKKGGLVIARHNEVKHELGFLATLATSPNAVCDEPINVPGRAANGESNCESNTCALMFNLLTTMKEIEDHISHQHQRRNVTPFVSSTDGLIGKEATALVKLLASMTAS